jgi:hypothetical protein
MNKSMKTSGQIFTLRTMHLLEKQLQIVVKVAVLPPTRRELDQPR